MNTVMVQHTMYSCLNVMPSHLLLGWHVCGWCLVFLAMKQCQPVVHVLQWMPTCCACVAVDANLLYMYCSGCQLVVHVLQWMPTCCTVAVDANLLYLCCSGCQPVVHVLQWMWKSCCSACLVMIHLCGLCCRRVSRKLYMLSFLLTLLDTEVDTEVNMLVCIVAFCVNNRYQLGKCHLNWPCCTANKPIDHQLPQKPYIHTLVPLKSNAFHIPCFMCLSAMASQLVYVSWYNLGREPREWGGGYSG